MKYVVLSSLMFVASQAEATEWPSLDVPLYQDQLAPKDRVVIISLETYAHLDDVQNASQNAEEWKLYFLETLGISDSNIKVLQNDSATKDEIIRSVRQAEKRLSEEGRLWIVYIGYGATSFHEGTGLILPFTTEATAKSVYQEGLSLDEIASVSESGHKQTIAIFDCSFDARDRMGKPLAANMPMQSGLIPTMGNATVIYAADKDEYARLNKDNSRSAMSYLLLGGLRGWADSNADGWVSLEEATEYADVMTPSQSIGIMGYYRKDNMSEAQEKNPAERSEGILKGTDSVDFVPIEVLADDVELIDLLGELEARRRAEVEIEILMNEQIVSIREAATTVWKEIRDFAEYRADDPARLAVDAFLKEYENREIEVRGQKMNVDIPEVSQAQNLLLQLATPSILGTEFARVKSGTFVMGNPNATGADAGTREIELTHSFYISTTEITQKLYQIVLNENPSTGKDESLPVTNVSWYDAIRFANALSAYEGFEECYQIREEEVVFPKGLECSGYRLPTEAEWEYAAKARQRYVFSGGTRWSRLVWTAENSDDEVHYVAQKLPNAFGLYDMSGNVWEWVWDIHAPYDQSETIDPLGAKEGVYRIRRGGSFQEELNYARVDVRYSAHPNYISLEQGFRLVRTAPEL